MERNITVQVTTVKNSEGTIWALLRMVCNWKRIGNWAEYRYALTIAFACRSALLENTMNMNGVPVIPYPGGFKAALYRFPLNHTLQRHMEKPMCLFSIHPLSAYRAHISAHKIGTASYYTNLPAERCAKAYMPGNIYNCKALWYALQKKNQK